jgi:hypothetical protein
MQADVYACTSTMYTHTQVRLSLSSQCLCMHVLTCDTHRFTHTQHVGSVGDVFLCLQSNTNVSVGSCYTSRMNYIKYQAQSDCKGCSLGSGVGQGRRLTWDGWSLGVEGEIDGAGVLYHKGLFIMSKPRGAHGEG